VQGVFAIFFLIIKIICFFQFTTNRRHKIQMLLRIRITTITIQLPITTTQNPTTRIRTTTKSTDRQQADENWKMSSILKKLEILWKNFGQKLRIRLIGKNCFWMFTLMVKVSFSARKVHSLMLANTKLILYFVMLCYVYKIITSKISSTNIFRNGVALVEGKIFRCEKPLWN